MRMYIKRLICVIGRFCFRGENMSEIIFIIGSVTTATRLKKMLEKTGVLEAMVIHTPSEISGGSCSYSVRVDYDNLTAGLEMAKELGIRIKKVYRKEKTDRERVYHDISG